MKIQCPNCGAGYRIDEAKIRDSGAHARCKKCQTRFLIQKEMIPNGRSGLLQSEKQKTDRTKASETKASQEESADGIRKGEGEFSEQEQLVERHIAQNNQNAAAEVLLNMIVRYAKESNFAKAEALHEKLYNVAPMSLNEIVKSGEIIEEEKRRSMDQKHLEAWSKIYGLLDSDEVIELYFAMKEETIRAGQSVYRQGQYNSNLYFVQEGRLKIIHFDQKKQKGIFLKGLRPGDIANIDPFFSFTVCTATLIAINEAKLTYIEKELLSKWKESFPGLETKLYNFCQAHNRVGDLVKKAGVDLRAHPRVKTSLKATIQLLDSKGKPAEDSLNVLLYDIFYFPGNGVGNVDFGSAGCLHGDINVIKIRIRKHINLYQLECNEA